MTNPACSEIAQEIEDAASEMARTKTMLRTAQEEHADIDRRRREAIGRVTAGDGAAVADLAALYDEMVQAGDTVYEANRLYSAAQAKVQKLKDEQGKVEDRVLAGHLGQLLEVRAAVAGLFEARLRELSATSMLLRELVAETTRAATLLGLPVGQHMNRDIAVIVARRLFRELRTAMSAEFANTYVTPEDPLTAQDARDTAHLRPRLEQILATPPASA